MQPEDGRRGKTKRGISRARILLKKNLDWLPGFPASHGQDAIRWWHLPPQAESPHIALIDRERLRRMEMTVTKLRHRFPLALPRLVEDVDEWLGRMGFLLASLKAAVHGQRELDISSWQAANVLPRRWTECFFELWHAHERLRDFLSAVFFLEATGRTRPSDDGLDWIGKHAAAILRITAPDVPANEPTRLELRLLFYLLREEMHPCLQAVLMECFAEKSVWSLPATQVYRHAESLSAELKRAMARQPFDIPP